MKLYFRPFPGLTLITLIMLAILIWLGTWQYHRLQWKNGVIAEVEAAVTAEPLRSFADITKAIENGAPVDFRRIDVAAQQLEFETPFRVHTAENNDVSWRVFTPVENSGVTAFAALQVIHDKTDLPEFTPKPRQLAGYVRIARANNNPRVKSTPAKNRWFGFNPMPETNDWGQKVTGGADTRFYIDVAMGATDAKALLPRRPEIRNNHFDYMLTWYGLAIVLLVIYVILHKREGRAGWR